MGVGIIAINMPSIWMVFASVTPDSIIRSIRSVVSLDSLGSRGSSRDRSNAEHLKSNNSTSSFGRIAGSGSSSAEVGAYELGSTGGRSPVPVPAGQIHISRSVQQTSGTKSHAED